MSWPKIPFLKEACSMFLRLAFLIQTESQKNRSRQSCRLSCSFSVHFDTRHKSSMNNIKNQQSKSKAPSASIALTDSTTGWECYFRSFYLSLLYKFSEKIRTSLQRSAPTLPTATQSNSVSFCGGGIKDKGTKNL